MTGPSTGETHHEPQHPRHAYDAYDAYDARNPHNPFDNQTMPITPPAYPTQSPDSYPPSTPDAPTWAMSASAPEAHQPFVVEPIPRGPQPPRRRIVPPWLWVLGGLVLGMLAMFLVMVFAAPQPRAATPQPQPSAQIGDLSVTVDDAFLSKYLNAELKQTSTSIPISNVAVQIEPNDKLLLTGDAQLFAGLTRRFTAHANVAAANGSLVVHITSATVGGYNAPQFVLAPIQHSINSQLGSLNAAVIPGSGNKMTVTYVHTVAHHMTLGFNAG